MEHITHIGKLILIIGCVAFGYATAVLSAYKEMLAVKGEGLTHAQEVAAKKKVPKTEGYILVTAWLAMAFVVFSIIF